LSKSHLILLGVGIAIAALVVSAANLGITLADVSDSLNLTGGK